MYTLVNFKTRKPFTPKNLIFADDNTPVEVIMEKEDIASRINIDYFRRSPAFVSKYLPFMPIKNYERFVSLSDGATPLIKSRKLGKKLGINLYFKYEGQNPTGSFKDRGSALDITMARELGAKAITVASTGNMAASCACYAAAAGIPCFVFVPEGAPPSKLAQVISYGGKIVQVKGSFNDAVNLAERVAEKLGFYLAGDYAFRVEGQKTAVFEIIDQLFYRVPDMIIVPMGCGTNMASYGKGLSEYRELGLINKMPQLVGSQAEGVSPIVQSFKNGQDFITPFTKTDTVSSAIAIGDPLDGIKAMKAIRDTKGTAVAVSDSETLVAQYELAKEEGLFVESSSATSYATLKKLVNERSLAGKTVVCVLTGNGLKDTAPMLRIATRPPTIYPEIEPFLAFYKNSYFEGKSVVFFEKDTVAFTKPPTTQEVNKFAKDSFVSKLSSFHSKEIKKKIDEFLKKGKKVTFADFQDIMQDVLETVPQTSKKVFIVDDFMITTGKDRIPSAMVKVTVNGKTREAIAQGVGPIDAIINALKKTTGNEMEFALTGFNVVARSNGTDAAASTEVKLAKNGKVSVGQGTSPDTLQASIEAFVNAYNGFFTEDN